jgi:hypothetical protein
MIPKKVNRLYKQAAEDLNVDEALIEDLSEFFYKELKDCLSNLRYPRVNADGLGHFVVKRQSVRKAIPRYTKLLETHDTSTFGAYHHKKQIEVKLEMLIDLEKTITEQEQLKEEFKNKKYGNTKRDLEE